MNSKISVIVPVYNVQDYIEECIEHIINQTFYNLEIILVDDGSTDCSGSICDLYLYKDKRIKVIHKENEGVAEARNVGLKVATGDYIGFIDSDDYPEYSMYEQLFRIMKKYQADISCCAFYRNVRKCDKKEERVYKKEEVFWEMVNVGKIESHPWNKLYRRELFENVLYPKGKTYEDTYITYKLIEKSSKIVYTSEELYFYRNNLNSISNQKFKVSDLNLVYASKNFAEFLREKYPMLYKEQLNSITRHEIAILRKMLVANYVDTKIENYLIKDIRSNMNFYMKSSYKLSSKLFGVVVLWNWKLMRKIVCFYRKIN